MRLHRCLSSSSARAGKFSNYTKALLRHDICPSSLILLFGTSGTKVFLSSVPVPSLHPATFAG